MRVESRWTIAEKWGVESFWPWDLATKKSRRERRQDLASTKILYSQTMAAGKTAAFKNSLPGSGRITGSKAVFPNSFEFFRLICVLHGHDWSITLKMGLDELWTTGLKEGRWNTKEEEFGKV